MNNTGSDNANSYGLSQTIFALSAGVFVVAGFVAAFIGFCPFLNSPFDAFKAMESYGQFGSYLQGSVGSFWTLAGVCAALAAFFGLKQQISDQKEQFNTDLERQKLESGEQRKQFEQQLKSIERQNFEASFFQLLALHRQFLSETQVPGDEHDRLGNRLLHTGRDAFEYTYRRLGMIFKQNPSADFDSISIMHHYNLMPVKQIIALDLYFNNLEAILRFISNGDIADKRRYTSLVRAQLPDLCLAMLFYFSLTPFGADLKLLVDEFGLLKDLNIELLFDQHHREPFKDSAFQ